MIDEHYLASLKSDEALRVTVYDDASGKAIKAGSLVVGQPTIGYGRCLTTRGITYAEADFLFQNDVDETLRTLSRLPWFLKLSETRQYVVLNMAFNMGVPGVLRFANMIAAIARNDYAGAAQEMLASLWARQVGGRAIRLARAMRDGAM